eukprot:1320420-Amorphochlora_amoeboformis.AAC.1
MAGFLAVDVRCVQCICVIWMCECGLDVSVKVGVRSLLGEGPGVEIEKGVRLVLLIRPMLGVDDDWTQY